MGYGALRSSDEEDDNEEEEEEEVISGRAVASCGGVAEEGERGGECSGSGGCAGRDRGGPAASERAARQQALEGAGGGRSGIDPGHVEVSTIDAVR